MRVIVTRPAAEAAEWVDALRARGHDAWALPLIEIGAPADAKPLAQAWSQLADCQAAMFVSANAVRGFFAGRAAAQFTPRAWATGPGTRNALIAAGVAPDRIDAPATDAAQFDSEALWAVVRGQCRRGDRVLLVRGGDAVAQQAAGRDWLERQLAAAGVSSHAVMAYVRTAPVLDEAQRGTAKQSAHDGSAWVFSSSQAIAHLQAALPGEDWSAARAVCTHPRIEAAARAAGFGVVCVSRPGIDDVVRALESAG